MAFLVLSLGGSGPAGACKPPAVLAEHLELRLRTAEGSARAPARMAVWTVAPDTLVIDGLGTMKMIEPAADLPVATQRYIRRNRRLGRVMCFFAFVRRSPAIPGRYVRDDDPLSAMEVEAAWDPVWPRGAAGMMVLDPSRETITLQIRDGGQSIDLEYVLTRATFSRCSVAPEDGWPGLLALTLLGLRRRRARVGPP